MKQERKKEEQTLGLGPWTVSFLTCLQCYSSPRTPQHHRKLLTRADNAQYHAHFHKYKAHRVGQKGTTEAGLWQCLPLELPFPTSNT